MQRTTTRWKLIDMPTNWHAMSERRTCVASTSPLMNRGRTVNLRFINRTAEQTVDTVVSSPALPHVVAWYGAYYHGDDYDVLVNSKRVQLDHNGELVPVTIEGTARETH